jgi:hypothetical protein
LLADRACAAVTADHEAGSQPLVTLRADGLNAHAIGVLAQRDQLVTAPDLHAEVTRIVVEDLLGGCLLDEHAAQANVARLTQVQRDQREVHGVGYRNRGVLTKATEQAPIIEDVHRPADERKRLGKAGGLGQPLQHDRAHPGQVQLAGEHQAGRPGPGDHDLGVH